MATCKACLYYEVCPLGLAIKGATGTCLKFKSKADFAEVIRCKDCKYYKHFKGCGNWCHRRIRSDIEYHTKLNDFCSYGERKDT